MSYDRNKKASCLHRTATAIKKQIRIATLNANAGAVDYMAATALVNISEAVKEGKVQTIVIPHDFSGIVNVGK